MQEELDNNLREKKAIDTFIVEEDKEMNHLKDEIRKSNKKISDVQVILIYLITLNNRKKKKILEQELIY
jgi:hypothetical protein